jgi:isoleucyl-tRNA synthetase
LNELFQHIVRWLAPIVVFTSEEAWLSFGASSSVHLESFLVPNDRWIDQKLCNKINRIKEIRKTVTAALEIARKDKIIGSSLQASVTIFDPDGIIPTKDESFWEEVAITSNAKIRNEAIPDGAFVSDQRDVGSENITPALQVLGVVVSVAEGEKCERCWKICTSLSEDKICERCQKVLARQV